MLTCTTVPITVEEGKIPTKTVIRDIIGVLFTKEWPFVDPETLDISYHTSFANAHCIVARQSQKPSLVDEPLKFFIKIHNECVDDLEYLQQLLPSKQEEASLCHEYSCTGAGARTYGFFKTQNGIYVRVDEFLNARTLEPEDVEDTRIRADIAQELATFHTMKTVLARKPVRMFYEALIKGMRHYYKADRLKTLGSAGGVCIDDLIDFDFGGRLNKVVEKLDVIGAKTGWCIHDVQYMNVLVRNTCDEGRGRIALIDFEVVMRNYRAFDIGGHFMQKTFKWFDEKSKIVACRPYSTEEKKHFCEEYARQWNRLTGDSDTGHQLLIESEFGYLLAVAFDIHNMLCFMDKENDTDPLNLAGLNELFYKFVGQYNTLGLQDQ